METLQQLRDQVAAGTMAQVWPKDPMQLARHAQKLINAGKKTRPLSIAQIESKLDWIRLEKEKLASYLKPAAEYDADAKELKKEIASCEASIAWANSQTNFQAESADAAATTQVRLDSLKAAVKDLEKRRDRNLKIGASLKDSIRAYATDQEIASWKDSLRNFLAIQKLNHVSDNGRYESFT